MRSLDWMVDAVKAAAGIHFSSFKDKSEETKVVEEGKAATGAGAWVPPPGKMRRVLEAQRRAAGGEA